MEQWTINELMAGAIVNGRVLRLPTLRAIAENSMGPIGDKLWEQLEPKWSWHDALSTEELQRAILASRSPPNLL